MQFRLKGSEEKFDHLRETAYCIEFSKQNIEVQKKKSFLNKLCFDYSLQKLNKQKLYGNLIPLSSKIYPRTQSRGNKFCNQLYSSQRVRLRKNKTNERYRQIPEQEEEIKKYRHILSKKKKHQQGGIDSFWIFKKNPVKEQKKKPKGQQNIDGEKQLSENQIQQNKTKQAFMKLLNFAKLPIDLDTALIPKNIFKNYISSIFGETFTLWFINFYQVKMYLNYNQFQNLAERFKTLPLRQRHLLAFFLYDDNGDGYLDPRDIFSVFQRQLNAEIDKDILKIGNFVKQNLKREDNVKEQFKIEHLCIRDDWLTVKDYEIYFKKIDQPYLKATNKKDTVFSKSFAVIDHREKVRSKRRQMNEKKHLYEQLYGQITKKRTIEAYIDSEEDYKLNYTLFYEIFGKKNSQLFNCFISIIFGHDNSTYT